MKKSQIISLVVLLILVTIVIWIGSFAGGGDADVTAAPQGGEVTTEAEATPEVTMEDITSCAVTPVYTFTGSTDEMGGDLEEMKKWGAMFDVATDKVFLTFETGYYDGTAVDELNGILDVLKDTGVKATFFISAEFVSDGGAATILKRIADEGHAFGNRGSVEIDMINQSIDEYGRVLDGVKEKTCALTGREEITMKVFRPFGCKFSIRDLAIAKRAGYKTVFWTVQYAQENGLSGLVNSMSNNLKKGGIYNIPIYTTKGHYGILKDAINSAKNNFEFAVMA